MQRSPQFPFRDSLREIVPLQLYKYRGSPYQNNQRGLIWQNSFGIRQPTTQMYVHVATAGAMYVVE